MGQHGKQWGICKMVHPRNTEFQSSSPLDPHFFTILLLFIIQFEINIVHWFYMFIYRFLYLGINNLVQIRSKWPPKSPVFRGGAWLKDAGDSSLKSVFLSPASSVFLYLLDSSHKQFSRHSFLPCVFCHWTPQLLT